MTTLTEAQAKKFIIDNYDVVNNAFISIKKDLEKLDGEFQSFCWDLQVKHRRAQEAFMKVGANCKCAGFDDHDGTLSVHNFSCIEARICFEDTDDEDNTTCDKCNRWDEWVFCTPCFSTKKYICIDCVLDAHRLPKYAEELKDYNFESLLRSEYNNNRLRVKNIFKIKALKDFYDKINGDLHMFEKAFKV